MLKTFFVLCLLAPAWAKPNASELCKQADKLLNQGKVKESYQKYEEAIQVDPRCAQAYAGRGIMLSIGADGILREGDRQAASGLYLRAIQDLSKAIQFAPKEPVSWANRGNAYYRLDQFPRALSDFSQSLLLRPSAATFASRAGCYTKMGQDAKAIADYSKAYELGKDSMVLFNRGNCYLRMDQRDKARSDYERVLRECKDQRAVAGAKANLEALSEGSQRKPSTAPNKPR